MTFCGFGEIVRATAKEFEILQPATRYCLTQSGQSASSVPVESVINVFCRWIDS